MTDGIRVDVIGLTEVNESLKEASYSLPANTRRACMMAGFVFEARAKWYATGNAGGPQVDTGFLRSSITTSETDTGAEIGPHTDYAADVEFGTSHSRPFPYLRPAFEDEQEEATAILKEYLGKKIFINTSSGWKTR